MSVKKKLILLGPAHPYRGGIAAFNHQLARIFLDKGWEVLLVNYTYQYPALLFPGKTQITDDPAPTDLEIVRKIHSLNPLGWTKLAKWIIGRKPDLIIGQYWMPYIGIALGSIFRKIKKYNPEITTATMIHNLIPHESKPGDTFLTKFMLNSSDYYISISEAVGKDILDVNPEAKLVQMFFPILNQYGEILEKNAAKSHLGLEPNVSYILFFGLVRKYKGLDLLIKAMTKVWNVNRKLLVVGEFYEDFSVYQKLTEDLQLQDHVIFKNEYIAEDEVKYYFSAADLVVLPYRTATQSGITQMALHFEKGIISTNVGGLHEVVKDGRNGFLVDVDANLIAQKINKFYEEKLEGDFSLASKELKEQLSWSNFYRELLNKLFREK